MSRSNFAPLTILSLLIPVFAAQAQDVFRWTDKDGTVHYSDKPPSPDAKPTALPKLQTFSPGSGPTASEDSGSGEISAPRQSDLGNYKPVISSPAAEETIRDAQRHVTVNASPPPPGVLLVYYLDGRAVTPTPTPSAAYLMSDVERGEHTVAVAAVSGDGRTLARSADVTFFMMPPMVHK